MAKFEKGQSGKPRGRPRGIQTQAKLRESIAKDLPGIITSLVDKAKDGDTAAAKLLLDRVLPSLRPMDQPAFLPLSRDWSRRARCPGRARRRHGRPGRRGEDPAGSGRTVAGHRNRRAEQAH
jgi:hypothetical protein